MAAFHPETIRLLQRALTDTNQQHKRDLERRNKLDVLSKSKMAQRLSERIGEAVQVARDLDRLIAFAEAVNGMYADHDAGLHDDGVNRLDCPACLARRDGEPR